MSTLYRVKFDEIDAERRSCVMLVEAVNNELQTIPDGPAFAVAIFAVLYTSSRTGTARLPLHTVRGVATSSVEVPIFEPMRKQVEDGGRIAELFGPGAPWEFIDEDAEESAQVSVVENGQGTGGYPWAKLRVEVSDATWLSVLSSDVEVDTLLGPAGILDFVDA